MGTDRERELYHGKESGDFHSAGLLRSDADRKAAGGSTALLQRGPFAGGDCTACNITRQGVRDSIKRAEGTLLEMEQRLGLARKFREYQEKLEQITSCAQEIAFEAQRYAPNRKIEKNAEKIVELAQQIEE